MRDFIGNLRFEAAQQKKDADAKRELHNLKARLRRHRTYPRQLLQELAADGCEEAIVVLKERATRTPRSHEA